MIDPMNVLIMLVVGGLFFLVMALGRAAAKRLGQRPSRRTRKTYSLKNDFSAADYTVRPSQRNTGGFRPSNPQAADTPTMAKHKRDNSGDKPFDSSGQITQEAVDWVTGRKLKP